MGETKERRDKDGETEAEEGVTDTEKRQPRKESRWRDRNGERETGRVGGDKEKQRWWRQRPRRDKDERWMTETKLECGYYL